MISPFAGMDPFLEDQVWPGFHTALITEIQASLVPSLRPRYVARVEERVYLEYDANDVDIDIARPDVVVHRDSHNRDSARVGGSTAIAEPILVPLPMPEEVKEAYLEVRLRETHEVVAVIEVLPPANKRAGSEGHKEYLRKRDAVLRSKVHLVEIDLLRGGKRMPTARPLPHCDFVVFVSRENRRPMAIVWPLTLSHRLPSVPVPLSGSDPEVPLDLQAAFGRVYERAGYDYSIDYESALEPPLAAGDQKWITALLAQRGQ